MLQRSSLTSLTIGKDADIVPIQGRCDQLGYILEDACLLYLWPKHSIKVKSLHVDTPLALSTAVPQERGAHRPMKSTVSAWRISTHTDNALASIVPNITSQHELDCDMVSMLSGRVKPTANVCALKQLCEWH